MSVSFIINITGKPKCLSDMTNNEITSLYLLLSGPIERIVKSEVRVVKNDNKPIRLSELSANSLSLLQTTVSNYKTGYISVVDMCLNQQEKDLILALTKNNSNVSQSARSLGLSRDEIRGAIKRFKVKWNIDLSTYSGLSRAYSIAIGC